MTGPLRWYTIKRFGAREVQKKDELKCVVVQKRWIAGLDKMIEEQTGRAGARNGRMIIKILPGNFGRWQGRLASAGTRA